MSTEKREGGVRGHPLKVGENRAQGAQRRKVKAQRIRIHHGDRREKIKENINRRRTRTHADDRLKGKDSPPR